MTLHIISDKKRAALIAEMFETVAMPGDGIEKGYAPGKNPNSHRRIADMAGRAATRAFYAGDHESAKKWKKVGNRHGAAAYVAELPKIVQHGKSDDKVVNRVRGAAKQQEVKNKLFRTNSAMSSAREAYDAGDKKKAAQYVAQARQNLKGARKLTEKPPRKARVTKMVTFEEIMKRKSSLKSQYRVGKHPNSHRKGPGNGKNFGSPDAMLVDAGADDAPADLRKAQAAFRRGGALAAGVELDKRNLSAADHGLKMRELLATPSKVSRMTMAEALNLSARAPETILSMTPERRQRNLGMVKEEIAKQVKAVGGSPLRQKRAHIIMGLPGAGKSALASMIQSKEKALLVDADEFKEKVAEFDNGIGANAVHRESSTMSTAMRRSVARTGANFIMPLVGSNPVKLKKSMDELKAKGYKVILHHVDVPSLFAEQRVVQRFIDKNRAVPTTVARGPGDQNATRKSFDTLMKGGSAYGYAAYSAHNIPGAKIRYAVLGTKKYKLPKEG